MNPEKRRRHEELQAEADMYRARAKEIFDRVEKQIEARRAREQKFFRRLFRRAA
jgi:hypothetical protein